MHRRLGGVHQIGLSQTQLLRAISLYKETVLGYNILVLLRIPRSTSVGEG